MYPSARSRARRIIRRRIVRAVVAGFLLAAQFVVYTQITSPERAVAGPAIAQTYYTPFEAQQLIGILRSIDGSPTCCSGSVVSNVSITSSTTRKGCYFPASIL